MHRSSIVRLIVLSVLLLPMARATQAQTRISVSPSTVNVNSQGPATAFLTFSGLGGLAGGPVGPGIQPAVPAEAYWCGQVISASPDRGQMCDPATVYGQLPAGLTSSQTNGGIYTDIMSMPASVTRRAYQAAAAGGSSTFYYVRRFVRPGRPDEYVVVSLRIVGGASVAFALTDVTLAFAVDTPVLMVKAGQSPPPLSAVMRYTGSGRLVGRWEVVLSGEDLPASRDLLTEATLPPSERGTQRRYTEISRFNEFLPPTGRYTLKGPDVSRLPSLEDGTYFVLLRIEASTDASQTTDPGQPAPAGPTAGFGMPVLRYIVGADGTGFSARSAPAVVHPILPAVGSSLKAGQSMEFAWVDVPDTVFYRLEVKREDDGTAVLSAIVPSGFSTYRAPSWLAERAGGKPLLWRVVAVDPTGREVGSSVWRRLLSGGSSGA